MDVNRSRPRMKARYQATGEWHRWSTVDLSSRLSPPQMDAASGTGYRQCSHVVSWQHGGIVLATWLAHAENT